MKSFIFVLLAIYSFNGWNQSKFDSYLDPVREGKVIDPNAWLINSEGDTINFTDQFKGKWLLIDYWSTGCKPCIVNFPHIKEFTQIKPDNLTVIYVNLDTSIARWKKGNKKYELASNSYFGGLDNTNHFRSLNFVVIGEQLMTSFPQYVLLDPNGRIVSKEISKPSSSHFNEEILALMK